MVQVSVITGGAGGMGLATARIVGRDHHVVIGDLGEKRLSAAREDLEARGSTCDTVDCDVADLAGVQSLMETAAARGRIASVIHSAGVSPQMGSAGRILAINALGTVNVVESFLPHATPRSVVVNVASMAAHLAPGPLMPRRSYPLASTDREAFMARLVKRCQRFPAQQRAGLAYSISKDFVVWYSRAMAPSLGAGEARILSVSPGTFDTEMGRLEERSGSMRMLEHAALKRPGRPEEVAELLAFCASDAPGYLTGTDILIDGGTVAGTSWRDLLRMRR